jgi:hypothetical protein
MTNIDVKIDTILDVGGVKMAKKKFAAKSAKKKASSSGCSCC